MKSSGGFFPVGFPSKNIVFIVIEWLHVFLLYVFPSADWVEEICAYYFQSEFINNYKFGVISTWYQSYWNLHRNKVLDLLLEKFQMTELIARM